MNRQRVNCNEFGEGTLKVLELKRRTPSRGKQAIGERATGEQATGEQATGAILELDGSHCNAAINAFAFARLEGRESSSLVNASLAKISSGAITCVR